MRLTATYTISDRKFSLFFCISQQQHSYCESMYSKVYICKPPQSLLETCYTPMSAAPNSKTTAMLQHTARSMHAPAHLNQCPPAVSGGVASSAVFAVP